MDAAFDERDVTSILSGIFDLNTKLNRIAEDLHAIRVFLEGGDEEEEEEDVWPPA